MSFKELETLFEQIKESQEIGKYGTSSAWIYCYSCSCKRKQNERKKKTMTEKCGSGRFNRNIQIEKKAQFALVFKKKIKLKKIVKKI